MSLTIDLPLDTGALKRYTLAAPQTLPVCPGPFRSRIAIAAAHVVPAIEKEPFRGTKPEGLDWDTTLAYRRHLWSLGFGVAEAMDTAQRGMGLDWATSRELIRRTLADAKACGGAVACGAGTDQLIPRSHHTLAQVCAAFEEQCEFVEAHGGRIILMASRALASCARSADDYAQVYGRILSQVRRPVILHWLGDMFDPALSGYWGARDLGTAMQTCLGIIGEHAAQIDGIKISLLDAEREIAMRRRLPPGVRMYTGDDFNYPDLIRGDERGYSHALLGILDAIAPVAAAAFHALDAGDTAAYGRLLEPTVVLSRHIFQPPTFNYKAGIVFLAYLNGYQPHFHMLGSQETARSQSHLARLFVLADQAGLLCDPALAVERMQQHLTLA